MVADATKQTEATLAHHTEAMNSGDIDAIMSDYTEESILFTPNGTVRGLQQIRSVFEAILGLPPEMLNALEIVRQSVEGEVAYLLLKAEPFAPLATDTFIVRNSKIIAHTFAAYMPSSA